MPHGSAKLLNRFQDDQFSKIVSFKRRSLVKMSAKKSNGFDEDGPRGGREFFEFPATRLAGEKIDKLGDIVGDKKATLVVNVASE